MLWVQCSALLIWSILLGQSWIGILLSMILFVLNKKKEDRIITDAQLQSLSDFSFVFLLVILIVINNEVDRPMEAFILSLRWSPLIFSPWMICRFFGRSEAVTLKTLIVPLRYKALGLSSLGRQSLDLAWPTSFLCLLASSTCEGVFKDWYYPALSIWGGFVLLLYNKSSHAIITRAILILVSISLGYGIHQGLKQTESYFSKRRLEWINRNSKASNLMLQTTMLGQTASLQLSENIVLRYKSKKNHRLPIYLKKSHFDQWLGNDTWFCTDPVIQLNSDKDGWIPRTNESIKVEETQPEQTIIDTLWLAGEGVQNLPIPQHTNHLRSTALTNYKRMGERMLKAHSDREWVKIELLSDQSITEKTKPYLERDLNVSETDAKYLREWLDHAPESRDKDSVVKEAARDIDLNTAIKIIRERFKNFKYSLTIKKPKQKISPLEYFLTQTQEGHCEYYATTVTLLLRVMGIPSRYCSGFLIDEQQGQWYVARGQDAHAWCEAWNGESWVVVDMTPSGIMPTSWFRGAKDLWAEWMFKFNDWRFGGTEDQLIKWAPSLLGLVLLYFSIRLWSEWKKNRHQSSRKKLIKNQYPDPGFSKFEKQMKKQGLERMPQESYGQWAKRLEQERGKPMIEPVLIQQWNLWAWSSPSPTDLENMIVYLKKNIIKSKMV